MSMNPALGQALRWRLIGPHRGGRVVAVAGDPVDAQTFYFGSTGGGVWKTENGGTTWINVSDGFFRRASVGAIAVAESDPNVVFVGMGEATIRGNVSHGDGVYKSTDAGKTWQHVGLADTRQIAKIRIHPRNADLVYVAALGHAHGPNAERGVYRSKDGGKTWEQVLFKSERAGAIDLAMDPVNPRVLYAAFWEAIRTPYSLSSGGPDSGLFRSTDGGDTWTEITRNRGLPAGMVGKIGVAVSPAKRDRVWAIVEAEDSALFRSDDGGETWQRVSEFREILQRPWYYMHVFADPQDPETVWVLNLKTWKSTDGGHTFTSVDMPHVDEHDLWIDPKNPKRMIEGSDGGACITFTGGPPWSTLYNQATAEFYHVTADNQVPYRVYGSQQDNTAISIPSFSTNGAITQEDWYEPGGGESGYIAIHPDDPNIVYAGSYSGTLTRYDHRTHQYRDITVWPENPTGWGAESLKYRFNRTFPVALSPHDPTVLYTTGNHVFRSADEGQSWEVVSPDLTRNDPETLKPSGGPITKDNVSTENYATIFAFAESPVERGVLWAGSDDGLIHISRDNGQSWQDVTPPALPVSAMISIIDASPHAAGAAYVAATGYKSDDFAPYLYKTDDYGQTWQAINDGNPADDFTRTIREDPARRGLLFAGTETGVYVSFDDGGHWDRLQTNLPVAPIHDLMVKGSDLLAATHGRSLWILDDITPLREMTGDSLTSPAHLFTPRATYRFLSYWGDGPIPQRTYRRAGTMVVTYRDRTLPTGELSEDLLDAGTNPPGGVIVYYHLAEQPTGEIRLTILDEGGQTITSFSSKSEKAPWLTTMPGLNRFVWDMRAADASEVKGAAFWAASTKGPRVAPGTYQVQLDVDGQSLTQRFTIEKDPRVAASVGDLTAQYELLKGIRDKLTQVHDAVNEIRDVREQLNAWEERSERQVSAQGLREAADALKSDLASIEDELIQVQAIANYDTLKHPIKLNNKIAALAGVVARSDAAPTQQAVQTFKELSERIDAQLGRLRSVVSDDLDDFNNQIRETGMAPISPPVD
jgi:photosystem II stability/assembly factor-like uncharacterized protein